MNVIQKTKSMLEKFSPCNASEEKALTLALRCIENEKHLSRKEKTHFTASAFVVDEERQRTLFVFHKKFQSYSFAGGHADGDADFINVAARELFEETGVEGVLLTAIPVSIDLLRGEGENDSEHINITYAFSASSAQRLRVCERENSDVRWFELSKWEDAVCEEHMKVVYRKIIGRIFDIFQKKEEAVSLMPQKLFRWFDKNKRDLPWRKNKDFYRVWISEIMLQQTRVEAVKEHYLRFLEAFPTVQSLAEAKEDEVLKMWEGLGYYTRAKNLHKAAKQIASQNMYPQTYAQIRALAGVGEYTAGAIGSIALGLCTPAVDGNVLRVLARVREWYLCIDSAAAKEEAKQILTPLYRDTAKNGDLSESLMELGALVCLPNKKPECESCPLVDICLSRQNGTSETLPVKKTKQQRKKVSYEIYLLRYQEKIALEKRKDGLLGGLYGFPYSSLFSSDQDRITYLKKRFENVKKVEFVGKEAHIFTHVEWDMRLYLVICGQESGSDLQWADKNALDNVYGLPTAFKKCLRFAFSADALRKEQE